MAGQHLADYARRADIGAIVPVGHGAAAALVYEGRLFAAPMDYEQDVDPTERARYTAQAATSSLRPGPRSCPTGSTSACTALARAADQCMA
jgi:hypothetical protein